jgi:transcription initiation factor TFIIF subunit beta
MKNPHKNMWELKPEYRHYKVDKPEDEGGEEKDSDSSDSSDED